MSTAPPAPESSDAAEIRRLRAEIAGKDLRLRELNHRLKNTFSGVVALLSVNPPKLSDEVRHWLDRVTQRISLIAQAHELFAIEGAKVALDDLLHRLRDSLPLAGSVLDVELSADAPAVTLPPAQAIPLAMALHELCTNAITHGSGGHGQVKLVARLEDGERAVFEVIDNGIARGGIAPPPNPQPLGLQLVRGLVTSELGGKFSMNLKDEGGMIARIAFPIGEGNER